MTMHSIVLVNGMYDRVLCLVLMYFVALYVSLWIRARNDTSLIKNF